MERSNRRCGCRLSKRHEGHLCVAKIRFGVDAASGLRKRVGSIRMSNCGTSTFSREAALLADIYRDHLHANMMQGQRCCSRMPQRAIQPDRAASRSGRAHGGAQGPGPQVRSEYQRGGGLPSMIAIHNNVFGNAHDLGLSYASAIREEMRDRFVRRADRARRRPSRRSWKSATRRNCDPTADPEGL